LLHTNRIEFPLSKLSSFSFLIFNGASFLLQASSESSSGVFFLKTWESFYEFQGKFWLQRTPFAIFCKIMQCILSVALLNEGQLLIYTHSLMVRCVVMVTICSANRESFFRHGGPSIVYRFIGRLSTLYEL